MNLQSRIYIAGHTGMVGSAIHRKLTSSGYKHCVYRSMEELDLRDSQCVKEFFQETKPEYVIVAAAKVGGILANNTYPADFIRDNLAIQTHLIDTAYRHGVKRLIFLGSSCIYPRNCPQPIKEEYLLSGPLEPTNQAYAIAKIAGVEMCRSYNQQYGTMYLALMPTNLYGPNDNYNLETSHVVPALIRKFHEGLIQKSPFVEVWGTGKVRREFLYVDDLADALLFLMELRDQDFESVIKESRMPLINIGYGEDLTIAELATVIKKCLGYQGEIRYNSLKPDGTPRKFLDIQRIKDLGWSPKVKLEEGILKAYADFLNKIK